MAYGAIAAVALMARLFAQHPLDLWLIHGFLGAVLGGMTILCNLMAAIKPMMELWQALAISTAAVFFTLRSADLALDHIWYAASIHAGFAVVILSWGTEALTRLGYSRRIQEQ